MKIAVLMSGGVDSSFAALFLKKRGFDVFGITFLHLDKEKQKKEIKRVKEIAKKLSFPHFTVKTKNIFEKEIISFFCKSFQKGITPNPCSFCNKKIKFDLVLKKAKKLGAEKIATGHYAIIREKKSGHNLYRAKDKEKDQSYFLWQLSQKELKEAIFPLGNFTKKEVLQKIRKSEISNFFKSIKNKNSYKESQDICFLQGIKLDNFLEKKIKEKPGPILNKKREKLGEHKGIHFFTTGQRSGIDLGAKSSSQEPFYVVNIDFAKNAIIVGQEKELYKKKLIAEEVSWVSEKNPKKFLKAQAQIRYRSKTSPVIIKKHNKKDYQVEFKTLQRAITPGQHVVFYQKDLLLGGGIIKKEKE